MLSEFDFLWNSYSLDITGVYLSFKFLFICCHSHYAEIWKHSYISTVCATIHANPSGKWSFSKGSSHQRNLKALGFVFMWKQNTLKISEYRDFHVVMIKIIIWFPCLSLTQTQIQNDSWLLCFKISLA